MFDSVFVRRQLDRFERNRRRGEEATREGYEFYDITAWSLPYTFGVDAAWTEDAGRRSRLTRWANLPDRPAGTVIGRAQSGYVFPGGREASARLAMYLLREGFRVIVSTAPLTAEGDAWAPGTFVVRVPAESGDAARADPASWRRAPGAQVTAVQSAFADSGMGIGSEQAHGAQGAEGADRGRRRGVSRPRSATSGTTSSASSSIRSVRWISRGSAW